MEIHVFSLNLLSQNLSRIFLFFSRIVFGCVEVFWENNGMRESFLVVPPEDFEIAMSFTNNLSYKVEQF